MIIEILENERKRVISSKLTYIQEDLKVVVNFE